MTDKTRFVWNWNLALMGSDAEQIAREEGLKGQDDLDSFRHAYVSAKTAERFGDVGAVALGVANEIHGLGRDTSNETFVDLRNNGIGLKILGDVQEEMRQRQVGVGMAEEQALELQDALLRVKIAEALNSGQLSQHTLDRIQEEEKKKPQSSGDRLLSHPYDRR